MTIFANIASKFKVGTNKYWLFTSIVFCLLIIQPLTLLAQRGSRIRTIVIDAGHGGKDPGASGRHSREKDITLAVALKLGRDIKQNLKDVKVIYTRTTDRFIPLHQRAEIANKNHADVFISIHCNSNPSSKPHGTESYVIGLHKSLANLKVAEAENASILYEDNPDSSYDGFEINSPQSYINLSLFQNTYLAQSLNLAHKIENQAKYRAGRKVRGVYQAGFLVLWRTTMPSVLVELGFLSNPKEESFLLSKKGQTLLASAIYRAFKAYKLSFEKENAIPKITQSHQEAVQKKKLANSSLIKKPRSAVDFRVQFYTSSRAIKNPKTRFHPIKIINRYQHNGLYKYTAGRFGNLRNAAHLQNEIRKHGYRGAFVVAFYQNKRISLATAKKLLQKGK